MDSVGDFLRQKTVRRFIALALFLGLLVLFRHLAVLGVFFVALSRALAAATTWLSRRTGLRRQASLLALVGLLLGGLAATIAFGVARTIRGVEALRQGLPERIAAIRETPLYRAVEEHLPDANRYLEGASHYTTSAVHYVTAVGHLLLSALIGLILAVLYVLEEEELKRWAAAIDPRTLGGTLLRWLGHLGDAVSLTIQLQVIVAICNAVLTMPIVLALGIRHAGALFLFIFVASLVPIVGNLVSGAVLSLLAYNARGLLGVGLFVGLTFVLHKVESYYLNPRLTSRHVRLPGLVLIVSLVAWEHLLGFAGLFVSFPLLFVAQRIRGELRVEDEAQAEASLWRDSAPAAAGDREGAA